MRNIDERSTAVRACMPVRCARRCRGVCRVDLLQVVAATLELVNLIVGHPFREPRQFRILAKEVVAVEGTIFRGEGLHLAVDGVFEHPLQHLRSVARE